MTLIEQLQGPFGGLVAGAYAMGAACGYGFAIRTAVADARKRIEALTSEIEELRLELHAVRTEYLSFLRARA
jgi:hypothetical protein